MNILLQMLSITLSSRDTRLFLNQNTTNPSVNSFETIFISGDHYDDDDDDVHLWNI